MIPKFDLRHLNLRLANGATILEDISLEIPTGCITAVVGPSGSGKSSLLRCLNRLWEPPAGAVYLDGNDITAMDVLTLRRRVGMLFQTAALFEGTVAANIAYGPSLLGQRLTAAQTTDLLTMAGLDAVLHAKPVDQLSGGQAQRVSLARTLANQPDVLLLDEPTSALDPAATRKIEKTIMHLRDTLGLTVLWVSHAFEQVRRTADRIVLLVNGRVAETGAAAHILSGAHHHLIDDFAAGRLQTPGG
ncbi:MAG: phosphate ABC transporter ATP-binding protein [Desulfobacterales bacterium]